MTHQRNDGLTSEKDSARTPPSLFKKLDERFHFRLDACASRENALCNNYWDKENDALKQSWFFEWLGNPDIPSKYFPVFCNPPYSNPEPFIIKAYEESQKGATVVMLLPADTSTKVFHYYTMKASEIIFIEGRVKFNRPDGTPFTTAPKFGSMVVVFGKETFDGSPVISSMRWK